MAGNNKYLLSSESRIFIRENSDCCPQEYSYHSCMRLEGLEESSGEITSGFCPHPTKVGEFVEVAKIRGVKERATTSLVGRIPVEVESVLYRVKNRGCAFDVQLHFGSCVNPTNFATFDFAMVLEDALVSTYSTDALGALSPDENTLVNETVSLSVGKFYYIRKLAVENLFSSNSLYFTGHTGIDVTTCTQPSCIACCTFPCAIYVLTRRTSDDRLFVTATYDNGQSWSQHNTGVNSASPSSPTWLNIFCDETKVYFTNTGDQGLGTEYGQLYSANIIDLFEGTPTWVLEFAVPTEPNRSNTRFHQKMAFFQGNMFNILGVNAGAPAQTRVSQLNYDGPNTQLTVYSANRFDTDNLPNQGTLLTHNDEIMMVGVSNYTGPGILTPGTGYVGFTYDGFTWEEADIRVNGLLVNDITSTKPIPLNKNTWLVFTNRVVSGANLNSLYCTQDSGRSWNHLSNTNFNSEYNSKATNNVIYGVQVLPGNIVKAIRSYDGGYSWAVLPDNGTISDYSLFISPLGPSGSDIKAIAVCEDNPNYALGIGTLGLFRFSAR